MMIIFKEYSGYSVHYNITCVILALFIYYYNINKTYNKIF